MKLIPCLLLILCPYFPMAQPLKTGDSVPGIPLTMLNYQSSTANLAQFKGKLLLLDFWATWCGNCIKKFPLLDSMQALYPGKLQVILVNTKGTKDTKEKIESFFRRFKNNNGINHKLPVAYQDTTLVKYFPHKNLPHYAWINKDMQLMAVTGPDDVTAVNIEAAVKGDIPKLDDLTLMQSLNLEKPLFVKGNAGNGEGLITRSSFSNYIPGLRASFHATTNKAGLITHYTLINTPLLELIKRAYRTDIPDDRIGYSDSLRGILFPVTGHAPVYSYELITAPLTLKQLLQYIKEDIERSFGISATFRQSPAEVYLLSVDSNRLNGFKSKQAKPVNNLNDKEDRYMLNKPLSSLTAFLNATLGKPVLQQTYISYNLDINLNGITVTNTQLLLNSLAAMGITLTPSTEIVKQFFIYKSPK